MTLHTLLTSTLQYATLFLSLFRSWSIALKKFHEMTVHCPCSSAAIFLANQHQGVQKREIVGLWWLGIMRSIKTVLTQGVIIWVQDYALMWLGHYFQTEKRRLSNNLAGKLGAAEAIVAFTQCACSGLLIISDWPDFRRYRVERSFHDNWFIEQNYMKVARIFPSNQLFGDCQV